jgi:hypothetical protein
MTKVELEMEATNLGQVFKKEPQGETALGLIAVAMVSRGFRDDYKLPRILASLK